MNEYVICPICSRQFMTLSKHIHQKHKMTTDEFVEEYPDVPLQSELGRSIRSSAAKMNWTDERRQRTREVGTANLVKFNQTQWSDPDRVKKNLQGRSNMWKSPTYRANWTESRCSEENIKKCTRHFKLKQFSNGMFRSSYENDLSVMLDQLSIKYEYESISLKYYLDGLVRRYMSDFYLPEYNLLIEVKPKKFVNTDRSSAKEEYAKKYYNYMFVTEDDLYKSSVELLFSRIVESSSTIES